MYECRLKAISAFPQKESPIVTLQLHTFTITVQKFAIKILKVYMDHCVLYHTYVLTVKLNDIPIQFPLNYMYFKIIYMLTLCKIKYNFLEENLILRKYGTSGIL